MSQTQPALLDQETNYDRNWFSAALELFSIRENSAWPDRFGDALMRWGADNRSTPINTLSLFSGGGGLDIGFHDAGFNIIECNEIEEKFAATLRLNSELGGRLQGVSVVCEDIKKYKPIFKNIDFIIGGPPCQTFSAAGARASGVNGVDDERGILFREYARIINELKPKGFLFENVYRIVGAQGGRAWKQILAAFRELGYELFWRVLDSADYGVPQFRERLIIVGLKTGSYSFPVPTHGPDSLDERPYYSAGLAVSNLKFLNNLPKPPGGRHGHLLRGIPPGLNYSFYTEKMGHPTPIFAWRSKFSDYLYKADPEQPVRTIKAQGGQYTGPFSWENRPFDIQELKRLQTFPDSYRLSGTRQIAIHQLGNSVPPQLARILALSIREQVFGRKIPFTIPSLSDDHELGFRARKSRLTEVYAQKALAALEPLKLVKSKPNYPLVLEKVLILGEDLSLRPVEDQKNGYVVRVDLKDTKWTVDLRDCQESQKICFKISVGFLKGYKAALPVEKISLNSYSETPASIAVLWKALEQSISELKIKDDLVQLFGYYQYSRSYRIEVNLISEKLQGSRFWTIFSAVSNGAGVGKTLSELELAHLYGVTTSQMNSSLIDLKKIGFEIRNHNTNKQIKKGFVLIPYPFPTLNERSLQRLTNL